MTIRRFNFVRPPIVAAMLVAWPACDRPAAAKRGRAFAPHARGDLCAELKPGDSIIAFVKRLPDGSFETNRISVGYDGLTAAM
jgi:hypothetical protein